MPMVQPLRDWAEFSLRPEVEFSVPICLRFRWSRPVGPMASIEQIRRRQCMADTAKGGLTRANVEAGLRLLEAHERRVLREPPASRDPPVAVTGRVSPGPATHPSIRPDSMWRHVSRGTGFIGGVRWVAPATGAPRVRADLRVQPWTWSSGGPGVLLDLWAFDCRFAVN